MSKLKKGDLAEFYIKPKFDDEVSLPVVIEDVLTYYKVRFEDGTIALIEEKQMVKT